MRPAVAGWGSNDMTVFDDALEVLVNDDNLGVDVVYTANGASAIGTLTIGDSAIEGPLAPIPCRGMFVQPDIEPTIGRAARIRDSRRVLELRVIDVASPAR